MSTAYAQALELLVNAAVSFAVSYALVLGALRLLRVRSGGLRLGFLLLPVAKLGWDLARGIPDGSFFWAHLGGVVRDSGSLAIGIGATSTLGIKLRALMTANVAGHSYGLSLGDLAVLGCDRLHPGLVRAVVTAVACVSGLLLLRRLLAAARFARDRSRVEGAGVLWRCSRVGSRLVPIYVSPAAGGVPYAAGLWRPYVCFPAELFATMTPAERAAALHHELAHVAHHHLALRGLVDTLASLFWFVPGIGALARRIADECELAADDQAVDDQIDGAVLAAALVKAMGQLTPADPAIGQALGRSKPRLHARVERLLRASRAPARPAPGRKVWALWLLGFAITAQTVLLLVIFTNL